MPFQSQNNEIHDDLTAVGLPIKSVVKAGDNYTPVWTRTLSPAEQTQANAILAQYDGRPKRPRALNSIVNDIAALTNAQQMQLFRYIAAFVIRANPSFAKKIGAPDGDELDT